ncbi:MAG: glycosyltransferase [Pseudomonadota bacterium]
MRAADPIANSRYLEKHGLYPLQLANIPPNDSLGISVVIPCYNEPDILQTLESLAACEQPDCGVEVLVVVNHSEIAGDAVRAQNAKSIALINQWRDEYATPVRRYHVLAFPDLPKKHAGVGLARKLGMDEAFARFRSLGNEDGIIASLDADCLCSTNYLVELHRHFIHHPKTPACSIYYEHPLDLGDGHLQQGIILYELYLRYYVHGLRFSGFPYAYQTLGSAFALRAPVYGQQGGMNRRQAGEDFYFLQKLMPLGNFTELNTTHVMPSARPSTRAPFGTGRMLREWLDNGQTTYSVYAIEVFDEIKQFCQSASSLYQGSSIDKLGLGSVMREFLVQNDFPVQFEEIRRHAASERTFQQRFYRWFNGLRVVQFAHFASDHAYAKVSVEHVAATMLQQRGLHDSPPADAKALLNLYREFDRHLPARQQ